MVPLDRALVSSYAVNSNNVAIWSGLTAVCNAKFPPALSQGQHWQPIRIREISPKRCQMSMEGRI